MSLLLFCAEDTLGLVSGERFTGKLVAVDAAGQVVFESGGAARNVPLELCEVLTRGTVSQAARPAWPTVAWLRSGAQLEARLVGGSGSDATLEVAHAPDAVRTSMRYLKGVRLAAATAEDGGFEAALEKPLADKDLLFVAQGGQKPQRLSVTVKGFAEREVVVEFGGQERKVALERIYGIVFAKLAGTPPPLQPMPRVVVQLGSGERFEGKLASLAADGATKLRLDEGFDLTFPTVQVAALRVRSDKLAYVSDLTPIKVEQTPAFDRVWPWLRDAAPAGAGIVIRGKEYARGIVMVPRTRLTFDIGGRYEAFRATLGIDDRSGPRAHATFRVLGDDKVLAEHAGVTHGSEPIAVDVPVVDVRRLVLEVDFGANFDLGDHCAFAAARLVKG